MVKVNIICVGKVKEKYFVEGIAEYAKRLSAFCEFSVTELPEENYKSVNDALAESIREREGERIKAKLKGYVFATAIEGKKFSSEELAERLKTLIGEGKGEICFVVGGSYGLSKSVKSRADQLISFSDMTFPHTLFRLMLTEQIYRAFCINAGSPYHK